MGTTLFCTHQRGRTVVTNGPNMPENTKDEDTSLVLAIASSADKSAFAVLFGRFAGRVKGFLIKSGASPEQAEEVAQEVMVTVWRKAGSFDPAKASVATWIYTIARNRRIDHIRREKRPEPDANDPQFQPDPEPDASHQISAIERDRKVREALTSLTEDQREVVQLAFFSGLSHGEIAEKLQAPLGTVKSRLRLSFARLRGELGDEFADELVDD